MSSAEQLVASVAPAAGCAHCGLTTPAAALCDEAGHRFCCSGCRAVFAVIHELGLAHYYEIRDSHTAAVTTLEAGPSQSYAEFDDPTFLARSARAIPGGGLATTFFVEGLHCAACVWLLEKLPQLTAGAIELRVDLPRSRATVRWDPTRVALSQIARRMASLGYRPHPCRGLAKDAVRRREDRALIMRIGVAGAVAGNVMAIAFALYAGMLNGLEPEFAQLFRWASLVVTVPSFLYGGGVFFRGAWAAWRTRTLHMDLPIAIGLTAGFAHGAVNTIRGAGDVYFDSVATLIFLLLVGRHLQRRQQRAAADAAELLAALAPTSARLVEDGIVREVPLETLLPKMLVEVRPGDTVPADGTVVEGRSQVDLALLTGESAPVQVEVGDAVHAGTVNLAARLVVRIEKTGEETRVGRLLQLVEEHAARPAPIVQLADRISGGFVAMVLLLAATTFLLWWRSSTEAALDHAVALLIVTCPCALGLATPLAVSAAIGQAARRGILIKGADVVEKLTKPARLFIDKTGTLSQGRMALLVWEGSADAAAIFAALEAHSPHPIARAVRDRWDASPPLGPTDLHEIQGGGVAGTIGRHRALAGSPSFVAQRLGGSIEPFAARAEALAMTGLSPVIVAIDGAAVAIAGFGDPLRADALAALTRIRRVGLTPEILSGDHPRVVDAVAEQLRPVVGQAHGGLTPEEKLRTIVAARERGSVVMVGDGINDAAALAAATVGIAVHGGAEAALAAADVSMARPGVSTLAELIEGSHRTMRVVRRNLVFSLGYNLVGVTLAMTGLLNPLIAAVMMPLSSLTVIVSSYRARTFWSREDA